MASSTTGVNKSFARCFIVFIVICILLEGAIYLGLSIWGLTIKYCLAKDSSLDPFSIFQIVMQLVYFNDEQCPISLTMDDKTVDFIATDATAVTERTYILLIVYACISAIWVLTAVIALVGLCSPPTRRAQLGCFLPFLLAVIAGSILDVVASVFFGIDISNTTTFESAMTYLDIKYVVTVAGTEVPNSEMPTELNQLNPFMFVPSVVMVCLSSRVLIVWILNIVGASFVFSLSKHLIDPDENQQNIQHFASERPVANPQVQRLNSRKEAPPPTLPKPVHEPQPVIIEEVQPEFERTAISYEPVEGVRRIETRTVEPLKSPEQVEFERQRSISPVPIPIKQQMNRQQSALSKREPTFEAQTSYIEQSPAVSPSYVLSVQQQLSADSPLNYRYSTQDFNSNLQGHNDEEKYGQLPWSYSKDLGDVLKARQQIMTNPNRNSDMPRIPEPDYTIHPNRRDNRNHTSVTNVNYGY
ncbi:hypothetical protein ACFFRR_011596 [Megaselia abdita]